jgi:decaprenyl-phosphate phosphoribosyltransferase
MHPADADALPLPAPRRGSLNAVLATTRPRQWIKNLLVIAAPAAAGALGNDDVPGHVGLAFVAFCLLSSGIYALNDVRDAPEDRFHPTKRFRPVAAGELQPAAASALGITLILCGMILCAAAAPLVALIGLAYVALTLSYTLVFRHMFVLDIVAIAGGFVLRAVAGGAASGVPLSRWFLLVVSAAALFVAAAKRYGELRRTEARRRVLDSYTPALLQAILLGSAAVTMIAYLAWAFQPSPVAWRALTCVPFAACLVRYGAIVRAGAGESPEDVLLADRPLQLFCLIWLVLFALEVHAVS